MLNMELMEMGLTKCLSLPICKIGIYYLVGYCEDEMRECI